MAPQQTSSVAHPTAMLAVTVAAIVAVTALVAAVGSDAKWLAALGHVIVERRSVPTGIPFAAAPTTHWPNVLVLAELAFSALARTLGDRGLVLAQLIAAGAAMTVLARDALAGGARAVGTSAALLLAALGCLPELAIARVQLFSLILFPVVLALLRAESRRPSRRIWLIVPLLALWSNLHGAALLGLAVLFAYLTLSRFSQQRLVSIGVGLAAVGGLCLTPALLGTVSYYHGVLTNVAAQRGQGLWGPLSLTAPLDLMMIAATVALAVRLRRSRPELWELAVIAALAAFTVHANRSGVWLLFVLVGPAARAITPTRTWERLIPLAAVASVATLVFAITRGPIPSAASRGLVAQAIDLAHGSPILATDGAAEEVALAGGRIWVADPIDAFTAHDQGIYLDWLQGSSRGRRAVGAEINVVMVAHKSAPQRLMQRMPGFTAVAGDAGTTVYERLSSADPGGSALPRVDLAGDPVLLGLGGVLRPALPAVRAPG